MEQRAPSKSTKLSAFTSRFQAHGTIARSLGPFCLRAARLASAGDTNAGRNLLAISGCVCSSSTSVVRDVQVPACRLSAAEDANRSSPQGNLKGRCNASKPSVVQKDMPKKSRFSNSFNKGYARVSDVSSTSCHNGDALVSPKSRHMEDGNGMPNFDGISFKNGNSQKADDFRGCHGSKLNHTDFDEESLSTQIKQSNFGDSRSTYIEQGYLCKREKLNFAKGYLPVVEYTWDPCKAFYESMLEMVKVSCVDVYDDDLEDMFAWYLVLNSSHHHAHIEEAFTILLTQLYKSKLLIMKGC